jgi:Arc/MetJ-type ribon-helix-helix transcriptional regulator
MPPRLPKTPDSEKLTLNLGFIDLGQIELLVREGFYSNRSDFIRTAIRNHLDRHADVLRTATVRRRAEFGLRRITRAELETAQRLGTMLDIEVLGLVVIDPDVTEDLARATISNLSVLGALQASDAIKAALADRLT